MNSDKQPSGATMAKRTIRVKDEVKQILEQHPTTRGDDRILAWRYYRYFSGIRISFKDFASLRSAPAFETISRRRRELQNEQPELRPTERVKFKRFRRQAAFRAMFGSGLKLNDFNEVE
jgi:hypothetical protein